MANEPNSNIKIEVPETLVRWLMERYFLPVALAGGMFWVSFYGFGTLQERREPQSNQSHKTATP